MFKLLVKVSKKKTGCLGVRLFGCASSSQWEKRGRGGRFLVSLLIESRVGVSVSEKAR